MLDKAQHHLHGFGVGATCGRPLENRLVWQTNS